MKARPTVRIPPWPAVLMLLLVAGCSRDPAAAAPAGLTKRNGFDLAGGLIQPADIRSGGPPRDGIPAIDEPRFVAPEQAAFLKDGDFVISVNINGDTRAYPLRILVWHEIVNDTVGGQPVAVTYCPLCGTAMVFDRVVRDRTLTFGVSGLLYQSDVLMYDRQTESLWSQLLRTAVTGPHAGTELRWLNSELVRFAAWKRAHPHGRVLSTRTGHARDYQHLPYEGYEGSPDLVFPVKQLRRDLPVKEWVVGVVQGAGALAFPVRALPDNRTITTMPGGMRIELTYDLASQAVRVVDAGRGAEIPHVRAYWFAWQAFYPETKIWQPEPKP